jgi:hypothetical protein
MPNAPFSTSNAQFPTANLNERQIAHRRAMLAHMTLLARRRERKTFHAGRTIVCPIDVTARRSDSLTSASWMRSMGSMNGSLLRRND